MSGLGSDDDIEPCWGAEESDEEEGGELYTVDCCFEIEFLVAKERADSPFSDTASDSDSSDGKYNQKKWICPHDEQDEYKAILNECAAILEQNGQEVMTCRTQEEQDEYEQELLQNDAGIFNDWVLTRSDNAEAKEGSSLDYEWFGVKLRSPMLNEADFFEDDPMPMLMLGALRMGVLIHVNSSCGLNIFAKPGPGPMSPVLAKKVTTLVWVTEEEMLRHLCPARNVCTLRENSRITLAPRDEAGEILHRDIVTKHITKEHLPQVRNPRDQTLLCHIWQTDTLNGVRNYLLSRDDKDVAFKIHMYDDEDNDDPPELPTFEFRYALWHPYDNLDTTQYWIRLCIKYIRAAKLQPHKFKHLVGKLDRMVDDSVFKPNRIQQLLFGMGLSSHTAYDWQDITLLYDVGDELQLSPERIDTHPPLEVPPSLRVRES